MPLNPSEDVPAEMWMAIFEELSISKDLHSVLLTCRKFHSYAIRALHRNVIWKTPTHLAHNLPLWSAEPRMALDVKSLEVHVSSLPEFYTVRFVGVNGQTIVGPLTNAGIPPSDLQNWPLSKSLNYYQLLRKYTYASRNLYDHMTTRITTFTNLESLVFRNLLFTDKLFAVIHTLPNLRKLHIEMCLFPGRNSCALRDHSVLPITDLTLVNLRRRIHNVHGFEMHDDNGHGHVMADMDDDITHILRLALAHNLQSLRIDSTADVLGRVFTYWDNTTSTQRYRVPSNLRSLYLIRKKLVPSEIQPQFAGEQLFPDRALSTLFTSCLELRKVGLSNQLARHTTFPDESLLSLNAVEGLPEAVMLLASGGFRPIEAVSLLWNETSRVNVVGGGANNNGNNNNNNGNGNGNNNNGNGPPWHPHHPHPNGPFQHHMAHFHQPFAVQPAPNGGVQVVPIHMGAGAGNQVVHIPGDVFGNGGKGNGNNGNGNGGGVGIGNGNGAGVNAGNGNGGNGLPGGNGNGLANNSILDVILQLSKLYPGLKMLAVETGEWEDEVLHAVCQLFPELQRMKLTYFGQGPSEVCLCFWLSSKDNLCIWLVYRILLSRLALISYRVYLNCGSSKRIKFRRGSIRKVRITSSILRMTLFKMR